MNQLNAAINNVKTKVVLVTPEYAEQLLHRNTNNRALRPSRVKEFVQIIKNDEWRVTHQGVALDEQGVLVDGQHRLQAIKNAGKPVEMLVTEGLTPDARLAIDTHAKRTYSDVLSVDRIILAPVVELTRIRHATHAIRPDQILAMAAVFLPLSEQLHREVKTHSRRLLGSGPVKAGAILRIASGEKPDYVFSLYRAMVEVQSVDLPPVAQSFMRQLIDGNIGSVRFAFVKSHIVFGAENRDLQKVSIKKIESRLSDLRDQIKGLAQ